MMMYGETFYGRHTAQHQLHVQQRKISRSSIRVSETSLAIQNATSEDSDQTVQMHWLIWIFARHSYPNILFISHVLAHLYIMKSLKNSSVEQQWFGSVCIWYTY